MRAVFEIAFVAALALAAALAAFGGLPPRAAFGQAVEAAWVPRLILYEQSGRVWARSDIPAPIVEKGVGIVTGETISLSGKAVCEAYERYILPHLRLAARLNGQRDPAMICVRTH